jgi:hypothetical protein
MKYLYLIIRHMFPRKRWKLVNELNACCAGTDRVITKILIYQDQFGNVKQERIHTYP